MAVVAAWILVVLGLGYTMVGLVWFRKPLVEGTCAGFVEQFVSYSDRLTPFGSWSAAHCSSWADIWPSMPLRPQIASSLRSSLSICYPLADWEVSPSQRRRSG